MALSGNLNSSSYDGRYYTLSWTATQSISGNYSTISWTLSCSGGNSGWYAERTLNAVIAGSTVYSKTDRVQRYKGEIANGTLTIYHDTYGEASFGASIQAAVTTTSVNVNGSDTFWLDPIPRKAIVNSAVDFNDEENPTITYTNPVGNAVEALEACLAWNSTDVVIDYRAISKTGNTYTFNLTAAERETLRKECNTSNSKAIKFYIRTTIGGVRYYSSLDKTFSIINATPTLTPTVVDLGTVSTILTGNTGMIKGYNGMSASVSAVAKKGATIKSYSIKNGDKVVNSSSGEFHYTTDNKFIFTVTDSRGNIAEKTIEVTPFINYIPLTCDIDGRITLSAADSTKADLTVNVSGNYFSGSFGAVNNTLEIALELEDSSGGYYTEFIEFTEGTIRSDGTYSINHTFNNLDYRNSYTVKANAQDKIYNDIKSISKVFKAIPVFDWGENDFNFNVPTTYKNKKLIYTAGDSIELTGGYASFSGFITDVNTVINLTIPISKPIFADGVELNGYLVGRGAQGYINGTSWQDSNIQLNLSGVSGSYIVEPTIEDNGINLRFTFNSAIANTINNTAAAFTPYGDITITFI